MKCLVRYLQKVRQQQRSRQQLLRLPEEQLKDIAVSKAEANKEGRKRFWQ